MMNAHIVLTVSVVFSQGTTTLLQSTVYWDEFGSFVVEEEGKKVLQSATSPSKSRLLAEQYLSIFVTSPKFPKFDKNYRGSRREEYQLSMELLYDECVVSKIVDSINDDALRNILQYIQNNQIAFKYNQMLQKLSSLTDASPDMMVSVEKVYDTEQHSKRYIITASHNGDIQLV
jgi:hypothetical protein